MSGTPEYNGMHDPNLLAKLEELKNRDLDAFSDLIFKALLANEEAAVRDNAPTEKKLRALNNLMQYFESIEKFEECAFLRDLIKRVKNGS